jgi:post-segregation antitoxin (ccd killing protein)
VTFNPGSTSQNIAFAVLGDTRDEDDETFTVNLSSPTNAVIGTGTGVATIVDNDATPSLSINSNSLTEGNSGTATVNLTVTLSAASGRTVTVNYATADVTATAGSDYVATSGTLTFAPGTTTQTVTVTVNGDVLDEVNETLGVNLSSPTNATIGTGTGVITIVDNATPSITINDITVTEGDSGTTNAVFTVTLSAPSGHVVTVNYASANGTATLADYTPVSGTLTFPPGTTTQTVTIPVVGDLLNEANETVLLNLSNATNATIADAQGQLTIADNDRRHHGDRGRFGPDERTHPGHAVGPQRPNSDGQLHDQRRDGDDTERLPFHSWHSDD